MAQKGGIFDASGQPVSSIRIVTDGDAGTGIGTSTDPLRVDPVGTTVQPVSISGTPAVTASGTVTANQGTAGAAAWKVDGSGVTQPVQQQNVISQQHPSDPAAGANISFAIPSGRWRIGSIRVRLTTSATVATRQLSVRITDPSLDFAAGVSPITQPASSINDYIFAKDFGAVGGGTSATYVLCGFPDVIVDNTMTLTSFIASVQTGDQISRICIQLIAC